MSIRRTVRTDRGRSAEGTGSNGYGVSWGYMLCVGCELNSCFTSDGMQIVCFVICLFFFLSLLLSFEYLVEVKENINACEWFEWKTKTTNPWLLHGVLEWSGDVIYWLLWLGKQIRRWSGSLLLLLITIQFLHIWKSLEQGLTLKYIHLWQFQTETSSELKTKNFF